MALLQVTDLKLKVSTAEQEREFYFNKLRDIEILCQLDEIKSQPVRFPCAICSSLSARPPRACTCILR